MGVASTVRAPLSCRVWNYEKLTKDGMPTLSRSIPAVIPPTGRPSAVSSEVVVMETVTVTMV